MGTKLQPGEYDCYNNALPDEPMFVLLARDPSAPGTVKQWAYQRQVRVNSGLLPKEDQAGIDEALECAAAMEKWRLNNDGKWRTDPNKDLKLQVRRALNVLSTLSEEDQKKMWEAQRQSWARQDKD